jgi:hypothetical protein
LPPCLLRWWQDFPLKDDASPPSSDFEATFLNYIKQNQLPEEVGVWFMAMRKF